MLRSTTSPGCRGLEDRLGGCDLGPRHGDASQDWRSQRRATEQVILNAGGDLDSATPNDHCDDSAGVGVSWLLCFEWDPAKAAANRRKHGIAFDLAATVFQDPGAMSIPDDDHSEHEERWATMGRARDGQVLIVIHTERDSGPDETTLRLISARRSTRSERRQYEGAST